MEVTMATRPPRTSDPERKRARPVPDPDSLAMDDRGTRPFRPARVDQPKASGRPSPLDEAMPDPDPDGNYIGDPVKPKETIRADEAAPDLPEHDSPEDELAPSDAPTLIRDVPPRARH
jgi:hypothetical protein